VGAQGQRSDARVEDIVILRSLRLSRIAPTGFCAASRTGFTEATIEDRYDFKAVATDAASGRVTNANGARTGSLHACFGATADSLVLNFFARRARSAGCLSSVVGSVARRSVTFLKPESPCSLANST
jgi:hypothetical protein